MKSESKKKTISYTFSTSKTKTITRNESSKKKMNVVPGFLGAVKVKKVGKIGNKSQLRQFEENRSIELGLCSITDFLKHENTEIGEVLIEKMKQKNVTSLGEITHDRRFL